MLYIVNTSKGKTPRTWHLWNIKIPKPPYISSLKIIELLHFWKILGPSEEIYNPQSLWITLYHYYYYLKPVSEYKRSGYSCWLALSLLARALPAFDSLLYAGNHLNSIYPTFLRTLLIYRIFRHTNSLILDNEDVWCKQDNLPIGKMYPKDLA